jgi:hypothetical protein
VAELNLNIADNIHRIGNYRYRPTETESKFYTLNNTFDENDNGGFYTDATNADILIDGGFELDKNDNPVPVVFQSKKIKENLLYSLEECVGRFRPRSGINKARYFSDKFVHYSNVDMASRPRYYMADKTDKFKYWTSYRVESNIERGISNKTVNLKNYIDDAAPYVVYKNNIPVNRIVVKMQTHVGTKDLGPFTTISGSIDDPFYGPNNGSLPVNWKIQYLDQNSWVDAISYNASSIRRDGTDIVRPDGHVEIGYGLIIPDEFVDTFTLIDEITSEDLLPSSSIYGYAYLVKENDTDIGTYFVWNGDRHVSFIPKYGWQTIDDSINNSTGFVTDTTSPQQYISPSDASTQYREFVNIGGIRIVVETMNTNTSTFDLVEMSPRLSIDITDKVSTFSIKKTASDLGISGMPVGQILAGVGSVTLFDYDESFNKLNENSIIAQYITQHIKFTFYEKIIDVENYDYYVPLKTLYSEGFPENKSGNRTISLNLRDMFFYLESMTAPQLFLQDVSLSYAISTLLDYIGFSNYTFKRNDGETELMIPNFYTDKDKTVAQILSDLAISSQSCMFFDEYNNFVVMSREYLLPSESNRATDLTLHGSSADGMLENIQDISSQDSNVYNDGKIVYSNRYIQKTYGSLKQASLIDRDKTWIYKPVLLWEVGPDGNTKSTNNESGTQSSYALTAIPLNSTLTANVPVVENNVVINNIMDLGENVYWITRYNGYFYANGEIIRYDAVEYNVPVSGNVWITSVEDYKNYFSKLTFNGKIYPTGRVRIYSKPEYQIVNGITKLKPGSVLEHGRGQFATPIVEHQAGVATNSYWSNNDNVRGCTMDSSYLFGASDSSVLTLDQSAAGNINNASNSLAAKTTRNGVIRNFLSSSYVNETDANKMYSTQTGTIQSSALIMNGPSFTTSEKPLDFISYVYKPLTNKFKHFGTRMRIVGKINNDTNNGQTPIGSTPYYTLSGTTQATNISGASGGISIMVNPATNVGYYFEIATLTENNVSAYSGDIQNVIFYKIMKDTASSNAIPVKLWGGLANIIVDDGKFTGQYRMSGEQNPTVYDLAVEYQDIGNIRRFFLYINNKLIGTVDDKSPLTVYNNMALFVRGSSRIMFENVYAITNNYSQNTTYALDTPVNSAFDNEVDVNESFRKYAMSGIIQSTYLSGISPSQPPTHDLYFEEFGTIMREMAYMNVRYDKAYPALYAKMSPTFNSIKGYVISGFMAGAYSAEFLVFNATDTVLSLDESTGNYLRIQGVAFTGESNNEVTVDNYLSKKSDFSNPVYSGSNLVSSPIKSKQDYSDIRSSRAKYGKKEFTLATPYVQTDDDANALMGWMIEKIMKPRKSVGLKVFSMPTIQLGDILKINYKNIDGIDQIGVEDTRYVVYGIDYEKSNGGPSTTLYLSEVA